MDSTTTLFALAFGLIIMLLLSHVIIRDANYSKDQKKNLEAITKLLSETARKQGVDSSVIENILAEIKKK